MSSRRDSLALSRVVCDCDSVVAPSCCTLPVNAQNGSVRAGDVKVRREASQRTVFAPGSAGRLRVDLAPSPVPIPNTKRLPAVRYGHVQFT
jgi:hypothetical protein